MKEVYIVEGQGRLDHYLKNKLDMNRSQIKKHIVQGHILLNGQKVKAGYEVSYGDEIIVQIPEETPLQPESIDFNILYEDEDIAVISKPQNLIVHPGAGNNEHTLVNGLLYHFDQLSNPMEPFRPGIVHRLDKDTSGLMIISKTDIAYYELVRAFKQKKVQKEYLAIVHGHTKNQGVINRPIGRNPFNRKQMAVVDKNGKEAISKFKTIKHYGNYSFVKVDLITGRTHQIRVHFSSIGHPVLGDPTYGWKNKLGIKTQMLHAFSLRLNHPVTKRPLYFEDDIPIRFKKMIRRFENQ
ncbi:MAG: RluA family pseudouridine synthase [Tissierellia bacterium]|nr:RluA family pseudouridine synthase [Tissierellia bacterium]